MTARSLHEVEEAPYVIDGSPWRPPPPAAWLLLSVAFATLGPLLLAVVLAS